MTQQLSAKTRECSHIHGQDGEHSFARGTRETRPELLQEEEAEAKTETEKKTPGLSIFTDRSRLEDGVARYSVVWKSGQSWVGIKTRMGYNQKVYDTESCWNARPSPRHWKPVREDKHRPKGSLSSPTLRLPSDGLPQNDLRGAWPWLDVHGLGKKAHRSAAEGRAGHRYRDLLGREAWGLLPLPLSE